MREMTVRYALTAALLSITAPAHVAAEAAQAFSGFEALKGTWISDCDAWGSPAKCKVVWSKGLHKNHLHIDYAIKAAADGSAIFSGAGVYRITSDGLDGYWSDSGGAVHPLRSAWSGDTLTTHWGVAGGAQGRSEYALTEAGAMVVTDWALTESGWRQFMQVEYARAGE